MTYKAHTNASTGELVRRAETCADVNELKAIVARLDDDLHTMTQGRDKVQEKTTALEVALPTVAQVEALDNSIGALLQAVADSTGETLAELLDVPAIKHHLQSHVDGTTTIINGLDF